jgi:hypothetical protein
MTGSSEDNLNCPSFVRDVAAFKASFAASA